MSAGSKIVQLRQCVVALLRYADHRADCLARVGGTCQCKLEGALRTARYLAGADPARTGGTGDRYSPRPKGAKR